MLEPARAPAACSCSASRAPAGHRPSAHPRPLQQRLQLASNTKGRLTALINYSAYRLVYLTSTDGGVLWSSNVNIGNFEEYPCALQSRPTRRRRRRGHRPLSAPRPCASPASRRGPRRSRAAAPRRARAGPHHLRRRQALARRRDRPRHPPGRAVDGAAPRRFGRARSARRVFRANFRARYTLRRRTARIPVRVTPRRGKARTLRLRVRRCSATR